jgi:hypothetical protein
LFSPLETHFPTEKRGSKALRWIVSAALFFHVKALPWSDPDPSDCHTRQGTGREFIWNFEEEGRRIRGVISVLPIPAPQFEEMIATCRNLERETRADKLVRLTLVKRDDSSMRRPR